MKKTWYVVDGNMIVFSTEDRSRAEKVLRELDRSGTTGARVTDVRPR